MRHLPLDSRIRTLRRLARRFFHVCQVAGIPEDIAVRRFLRWAGGVLTGPRKTDS